MTPMYPRVPIAVQANTASVMRTNLVSRYGQERYAPELADLGPPGYGELAPDSGGTVLLRHGAPI